MKSILFSAVLVFAGLAQAQLKTEALNYHNMANCTGWYFSSQANGYVCSSYPFGIQVPDAQSTLSNLRALDARIKALEAKVQLLESKTQQ